MGSLMIKTLIVNDNAGLRISSATDRMGRSCALLNGRQQSCNAHGYSKPEGPFGQSPRINLTALCQVVPEHGLYFPGKTGVVDESLTGFPWLCIGNLHPKQTPGTPTEDSAFLLAGYLLYKDSLLGKACRYPFARH